MAGCEAAWVRSLAHGSASGDLAGAVCYRGPQRVHAICVLDVLRLPAGAWRHFVLSRGLARVLVGDDLFRGWVRDRIRDRDFFSHREPMVCDDGFMAWGIARRSVYGGGLFFRALLGRGRGGGFILACGGGTFCGVGGVAGPRRGG